MNKLNLKNINLHSPYTFNTYENRHKFVMKTAEGKLEDQNNFMALIAKVDNPRLDQAIEEFEETAEILFGLPPNQHNSLWKKFCRFIKRILHKQ